MANAETESFLKSVGQGFGNAVKKAKVFEDAIAKATDSSGNTILHSNAPINAINSFGKFVLGQSEDVGFRGLMKGLGEGKELSEAAKAAYIKAGEDGAKGGLNFGAIAGTYVGASIAGRAIGGGGLYRDHNGNADIVGIPFI